MMAGILAFLLTPTGRALAGGLVILAVISGVYLKGRSDGAAGKQAEWDAAVKAAIGRGESARRDAERDVDGGMRDDQFNRD